MKTVSFSQIRTLLAIAFTALAYAFAAPASAQAQTSCSGCTTTPTIGLSFQFGGAFGGTSEALATNGGPTYATSTGGLNLNAVMNGASNGCTTGCGAANFTGTGTVWQNTTAGAQSQGVGSSAAKTIGNGAVLFTFGQ